MKTLPDTITRWDELSNSINHVEDTFFKYDKFINFVKRKFELWMVIPCGKDGKPLKKPELYDWYKDCLDNGEACNLARSEEDLTDCKEYQEAKARCLFSGFTFEKTNYNGIYTLFQNANFICSVDVNNNKTEFIGWYVKTIADLCNKVQLTPTGEKECGYEFN